MRILYVTLGYGYGAGKVLQTLIRGMLGRGHDVAVVSRGSPHAEWSDAPARLSVYEYDRLVRVIPTVQKALREFRPDVIHGHMLRESTLAAIAWRLKGRPVPYIHSEPGQADVRSVVGRLAFRLLAGLTTRIVSPSDEALASWLPVTRAVQVKGIAINNAVDMPVNQAPVEATRGMLGVPADAIVLLNVASVSALKNQKMIARALSRIRPDCRHRLHLVIAGGIFDEEERSATMAEAAQAGLADQVMFLGFRDDIPDLYAACDIAVLSSHSESFGLAVIEGMAAAKPVVSTACGGPNDIVVDGETGFLVPVDDAEAMAKAIEKLIEDPDLARRMGEAGRRRVEERYSVKAFCDAYEDLYQEAVEEWGAR